MVNIAKVMLIVFAIQVVFLITGIATVPGTAIYEFAVNPVEWDIASFISMLMSEMLLLAGGGIIVGSLLYKSDLGITLGVTTVFLSFGQPLATLYSRMSAELGTPVGEPNTLVILLISPLIFIFVFTIINWWRRGSQ